MKEINEKLQNLVNDNTDLTTQIADMKDAHQEIQAKMG
jgi:hypothetical protein